MKTWPKSPRIGLPLFGVSDALAVREAAGDAIWNSIQKFKGDPRGNDVPRCTCCGTSVSLHNDYGSGGPYRCASPDCMVW